MPTSSPRRVAVADLIFALGVLAFGTFFLVGVFSIRVLPSYANIGPRFFPFVVSVGLLLCGSFLLMRALLGKQAQPQQEENVDVTAKPNWRALAFLAGFLLLHLLLIERLGFIVASSLLFWGVAFSFGSKGYLRDTLIAIILSTLVYFVFTRLLNLNLPEGILPFMVLLH
jgi:putative tricarboxylic transport membrane protein